MRNVILALAAILAFGGGAAAFEWKEPPSGLPETFTIGLHAADTILDGDYALAAGAGFNLAVPVRPGLEYNRALLKACAAAKIKAVVWDSRIASWNVGGWELHGRALEEYRKSEATAGYVLYDTLLLPPPRAPANWWRVREIGGADPAHFRYVESVHPSQFPNDGACRDYLRRYFAGCSAYVLYEEAQPFSAAAIKAMKMIAEESNAAGRVWWRRTLLTDASPAMLRWQACSAAAAGAKAVFWLAIRPMTTGKGEATLLGDDGEPAPCYEAAKAVNARLAAFGPLLMRSMATTFYTIGDMPENVRAPNNSPIASLTSDAERDGFLVGLPNTGDSRYAFIVRKPSDADKPAQVQVQLTEGTTATLVETGQPLAGPLSLLPGEGQLLQIK